MKRSLLRSRMSVVESCSSAIEECHRAATHNGLKTYADPATGYSVFTEKALLDNGFCCGNDCRHCPYAHFNVSYNRRVQKLSHSMLLSSSNRSKINDDFILYDGSYDSLKTVAACSLSNITGSIGVLLSIYDPKTSKMVENDRVDYYDVFKHAKVLKTSLLMISNPDNANMLSTEIDETIELYLGKRVVNLIVGPSSMNLRHYTGKHKIVQVEESSGENLTAEVFKSVIKLIQL